MIKLQLINADIIYDTVFVMSRLFRKSFNCRYNPRMDYAFYLLTLKSSEKWRSPLFGATCNFNDQILPYTGMSIEFEVRLADQAQCPLRPGVWDKWCKILHSRHLISLLKLHFFVLLFSYFQQLFKIKRHFFTTFDYIVAVIQVLQFVDYKDVLRFYYFNAI
jgi:hypothetical protein